jgi:hypothetical protein
VTAKGAKEVKFGPILDLKREMMGVWTSQSPFAENAELKFHTLVLLQLE